MTPKRLIEPKIAEHLANKLILDFTRKVISCFNKIY